MKSAEKTISPAAIGVMAIGALLAFLASVLLMPAAELIQAHVQPARRVSGESPIRNDWLMVKYAEIASVFLNPLKQMRPPVPPESTGSSPNPPPIVLPNDFNQWQQHVVETLKPSDVPDPRLQVVPGNHYVQVMEEKIGTNDLQRIVELYLKDPNYPYYAYGLFLGLAMLFASIAILAIGRYEAEEITVLPVKK